MRTTLLPMILGALAACDGEGLEIVGTYTDGFGTHEIRDDLWTQDFGAYGFLSFGILDFDNEQDWLIALNGDGNDFNGGQFSRFEWVTLAGQLFACQVLFDGTTEQDARDAGPADAGQPQTEGCAGFPWTALTPQ